MEKKKLIHVNRLTTLLLAAGLLISTTLMFSCNDKKAGSTTEPTGSGTGTVKETVEGQDFLKGAGEFAVLKIDSANIWYLFSQNNKYVRKLLLEFTDSNATSAPIRTINAIAYAIKPSGDTTGKPVVLFPENIAAPQVWDTTGVQMLGNNEFTKRQAKIALGIPLLQPITEANSKTLYFYPVKRANNHIAYIVSRQLIKNFGMLGGGVKTVYPPGGNTNPSPPAPPCVGIDCEQ